MVPSEPGTMASEWVEWHRQYDEARGLHRRLEAVRLQIRLALDRAPRGPIRVISMCAGDGRDLVEVLADHPRAGDVRARLVELDPELVRRGRERITSRGLAQIEFHQADAGTSTSYAGAVPADVILACGIWGNVTDGDIRGMIEKLPMLAGPGATVIWTRGRFAPDLTPTIRRWLIESGFDETAFVAIPDSTMSVGAARLRRPPVPYRADERLFTFLPPDERPSSRGRARSSPSSSA
jgi:hypothetical protein